MPFWAKNLLARITEFLSLFVTVKAYHLLYLPELNCYTFNSTFSRLNINMKLLQSVYVINSVTVLIASINIKGLNIGYRYRKTWLMSRQWEIDITFNIWFTIFPPRLKPPLSEANIKSYPPLFEIHPNWCMQIVRDTLKWRCYISYLV